MAITRVQLKAVGTADYDVDTIWTTNLNSSPTVGNTLLLYLYSYTALSITSIVQGGSSASWTLQTFSLAKNRNIYVYALENVPSGSTTEITLTLGSASTYFCAIIEEISELQESSILDQYVSTAGNITNTYNTGTTSATTVDNEYWVNVYSSYDPFGSGAAGTNPTNGYTIEASANPISVFSPGWIPNSAGSGSSPLFNAVMIIAYKIVSSTGTAGGSIDDSNATSSNYNGLALSFKGSESPPPPVASTRRRTDSVWF